LDSNITRDFNSIHGFGVSRRVEIYLSTSNIELGIRRALVGLVQSKKFWTNEVVTSS